MKVRDLRKRKWYVTYLDEVCRYAGKVNRFGKVYYRFDLSSPHCSGDGGKCDRLGIYFEPVYFPARSEFIRKLQDFTSFNSCCYVERGDDGDMYIYDHGIRRALQ